MGIILFGIFILLLIASVIFISVRGRSGRGVGRPWGPKRSGLEQWAPYSVA